MDERFRDNGHNVYLAPNGLIGLELLAKHSDIALVISDFKMPKMNGGDFIAEARKRGHKQPFIFFTAYATSDALGDITKHGVYALVEKGPRDNLDELIRKCLNENPDHVIDDLEKVLQEIESNRD